MAIFTFPEARIVKTLETPPTAVAGGGSFPMRWTADGRALTYVDNRGGASNIWSLPVDGSAPKALTDFKQDRIFSFAWSQDGRQLAVSRGSYTHDVFRIAGLRKVRLPFQSAKKSRTGSPVIFGLPVLLIAWLDHYVR